MERYFTFLRDSAAPPRIVLGDARLSLAGELTGSSTVGPRRLQL